MADPGAADPDEHEHQWPDAARQCRDAAADGAKRPEKGPGRGSRGPRLQGRVAGFGWQESRSPG
jgi:hypothetical protein